MELIKRFFDADGSRCIMFYYQSVVKDDVRITAGNQDQLYCILRSFMHR